MSNANRPSIEMNGWTASLIVFFTMIALLIFKPEIYSTIFTAIIQVINSLSSFTVFKT